MKITSLLNPLLTGMLIAGMILPLAAQIEKGTQDLYETAGKKQTTKDFKPASDEIQTNFGPEAPEGNENNWIPTNPKKGFFLVFRFYGPLEGIIDKTWKLNDLDILH